MPIDEAKEQQAFEVEDSKHAGWSHLSSYHEMRWQVWLTAKREAEEEHAKPGNFLQIQQGNQIRSLKAQLAQEEHSLAMRDEQLTAETARRKAAEALLERAKRWIGDDRNGKWRKDYDAWQATIPEEEPSAD